MKRSLGCAGSLVAFVLLFAFVGLIASCLIVFAIWPGELKLFAPIFCTDAQPDAFVVTDTYQVRPGETTTTFTMYCMGPDGDATDVGLFGPFIAASILNGVVITIPLALALGFGIPAVRRAARGTTTSAPNAPRTSAASGEPDTVGARWEPPDVGASDGGSDDDQRADAHVDQDDARRSPPPPGSTAGPFVD